MFIDFRYWVFELWGHVFKEFMIWRSLWTTLKCYFLFFLGQFYHTLEKHEDIDDENALYAKPVKKGKVHVRLYIVFIYIYL